MTILQALAMHPLSPTVLMEMGVRHFETLRIAFYVRPVGHGDLGLFARLVTVWQAS